MRILAVSDQVIDRLYSAMVKETYSGVQAIIGCGDLPYEYLEFLVSILNVPLFYVPGNHDPQHGHLVNEYVQGGTNLDLEIHRHKNIWMSGLGGSVMYHPGAPNQYTQSEMYLRVYKILPRLWLRAVLGHPIDILVTHSPPAGIHDDNDPAHQGLRAINLLLRLAKPRYMLHGHTFFYRQNLQDYVTRYHQTDVINVYPFRVMNIPIAG